MVTALAAAAVVFVASAAAIGDHHVTWGAALMALAFAAAVIAATLDASSHRGR